MSIAAVGCGDDANDDDDAGVTTAGRGGSGGSGGGGSEAIVPLADDTAGQPCSGEDDCGSGTCFTTLPGAFGTGSVPAPGGYCSGECLTHADCGQGGVCLGAVSGLPGIAPIRGYCLDGCEGTGDCREGYRCVNGLGLPLGAPTDAGTQNPIELLGGNNCQPLPPTDQLADGVVGSACAEDADCGDGRCMRSSASGATAYPEGYCTGSCLEDAHCGATGSCSPGLAGGAGTCFLRCASDADCTREGYRCRAQTGGGMQCVPGPAPLPDGVVGSACSVDADCGGAAMSCATRLGQYDAPGGYCTQRCVDASDCGDGGVCLRSFAGGTCYRACGEAAACREGYTCAPAGRSGSAATQNICSVTPPPDNDAGTE